MLDECLGSWEYQISVFCLFCIDKEAVNRAHSDCLSWWRMVFGKKWQKVDSGLSLVKKTGYRSSHGSNALSWISSAPVTGDRKSRDQANRLLSFEAKFCFLAKIINSWVLPGAILRETDRHPKNFLFNVTCSLLVVHDPGYSRYPLQITQLSSWWWVR